MTESRLWQVRGRVLDLTRPVVMGIVNVTPDSFSDGGRFDGTDAAVAHALDLVGQGADLLDVGGESTRPGSQPVSLEEELARVLPVVREVVRQVSVPLSVDTSKAEVARQALDAGAHIINDVTALRDPDMAAVLRGSAAGVILMHMQGTPATMQLAPTYADVVAEVYAFLEARLQELQNLGIAARRLILDPGIGFGKTVEHNLELLAKLDRFGGLGRPVCLGVSRKGFLGKVLGRGLPDRLAGSLAAVCHALDKRAAQVLRVHDVAATRDAVELYQAIHKHDD
jgi:dihydropteroate synthase